MNARVIPELIIFDSDGVLVDSEVIALTVFARIAAEEGVAISVEDAVRCFRGVKMADCVREIERRTLALHPGYESSLPMRLQQRQ